MTKESGKGLYKKRYATLKEHRAAVAASKTNKGGKNVGPVAHGQSYANSLKVKPAEKKPAPAAKPAPKATTPKPTPKTTSRPNQTTNGASLGSKITPAERKKREESMKPSAVEAAETKTTKPKPKPKRHRGGSRANNNTRGRTQTSNGPKAGDTRRTRKGSSYVTQMYDGKKWINGKVGGKG